MDIHNYFGNGNATSSNITTLSPSNATTTLFPSSTTTMPTISPLPINPQEKVPIYSLVFAIISSIFSILGCLAILWVFIVFRDLRSTSRKLLMYLTIADFLTAVGNLAGVARYINLHYVGMNCILGVCDDPGLACKIQSFITTSSSLMSFLWMMVISGYFHISVGRGNTTAMAEKLLFACHVVCWGMPLILVSSAAGLDLLGEDESLTSGSWCWLTQCGTKYKTDRNPFSATVWMLITGKFFEILCYIMLVINYAGVKYILIKRRRVRLLLAVNPVPENWGGDQRQLSDSDSYTAEDGIERLDPGDAMFIYLPIIMLVLRIWGTLKFLILAVSEQNYIASMMKAKTILTLLQGIGDSGQGWMNFLLFCVLTDEVRDRIKAGRIDTADRPNDAYRRWQDMYANPVHVQGERSPLLVGVPRAAYTEPGRSATAEAKRLRDVASNKQCYTVS